MFAHKLKFILIRKLVMFLMSTIGNSMRAMTLNYMAAHGEKNDYI